MRVSTAIVCCLLACAPSWAADASQSYRLEIPSQPLASALNSLALQSDTQILFEQARVSGLQAPSVSGEMPVEQAVKALLAGTELEAMRNPDGTLVVRARPPVARSVARKPAPLIETRTPLASRITTTREVQSPWSLRVRGVYRDFNQRSDAIALAGAPGNSVLRNELRIHNAWAGEFGAEYHFTPHASVELAVSPERSHSLWTRGAYLDGLHVSAQSLTLKHDFLPESVFRPYVGIGASHIRLSGVSGTLPALVGDNWNPVLQAGADLRLGQGWFLNADVRYTRLKPDPLFWGIGLSYRFTRTVVSSLPAPPPPAPVSAPPPVVEPIAAAPAPPPPAPPADSDHDGVRDDRDRCPATPPAFRVDADGCEIEETVLAGVNFHTDSAVLADDAQAALDPVVAALKLRPGAVAEVLGYTDDRGTAAHNQQLSERRAAAVAQYLRINGPKDAQIGSRGEGESMPIASNATEEGRARNRRVTIRFTRPLLK